MPDIYCSKCGEPWDIYELHDVPSSILIGAQESYLTNKRPIYSHILAVAYGWIEWTAASLINARPLWSILWPQNMRQRCTR